MRRRLGGRSEVPASERPSCLVGRLFGHGYHVVVSATDEVTAGGLPPRVPELIDAKVPADRAEAVRAFAGAFTKRMTPQDIEERTPEELLGIILGAFELADTRAP